MRIKNIIFDLGGVIIDIHPERSLQALKKFKPDNNVREIYQHSLFHKLEIGQISPDDFRQQIKTTFNIDATDEQIDAGMNAMLGEIPVERVELLDRTKQRFFTLLLSNTNAIHHTTIERHILKTFGAQPLDNFFHKTYYSYKVGLRKPDTRIFELVLKENNIAPEETLYLDDTEEHLKSAQTLGIQIIKVTPENSVVDILKDF